MKKSNRAVPTLTKEQLFAALSQANLTLDDMRLVVRLMKEKGRELNRTKGLQVLAKIKEGTHVRISRIRPHYLEGIEGSVTSIDHKRRKVWVTLKITKLPFDARGRYSVGDLLPGIPTGTLEVK